MSLNFTRQRIKVLIGCHPKGFDTHWQYVEIKEKCEKMFPGTEIIYETVDVLKGGTFIGDIFGSNAMKGHGKTFLQSKKNQYDAIWVPDCGGAWADMFNKINYNDKTYNEANQHYHDAGIYDLQMILLRVMSMLTPSGVLCLSKIILPDHENDATLFSAMILSLGYSVKEQWIMHISSLNSDIPYVIINNKQA